MRNFNPYFGLVEENSNNIAWSVIYTNPNCEFMVNYDLFERGFDTYLPITEITRNNEKVKVPFLTRYLFVKECENISELNYVAGITHIVSFGDNYATISDNVIAQLRARECDSYPKYIPTENTVENTPKFLPNELVRIILGPHSGSSARFERKIGKQRAIITTQTPQHFRLNVSLQMIVSQKNYKPINAKPAYRLY